MARLINQGWRSVTGIVYALRFVGSVITGLNPTEVNTANPFVLFVIQVRSSWHHGLHPMGTLLGYLVCVCVH
jgi:hypothetical protein